MSLKQLEKDYKIVKEQILVLYKEAKKWNLFMRK